MKKYDILYERFVPAQKRIMSKIKAFCEYKKISLYKFNLLVFEQPSTLRLFSKNKGALNTTTLDKINSYIYKEMCKDVKNNTKEQDVQPIPENESEGERDEAYSGC